MYRRKYRRRYKKRGYRPRKYTAFRVYKALNRKVNAINEANRPEMQIEDFTAANADIFTTGTITKLEAGASASDKINIHSIQMNGLLELDTETAAVTSIARIILFVDRRNTDPDNDSVAWTDVWKAENVWSMRARTSGSDAKSNRFMVLFDNSYTLNADTDGTTMSKKLVKYYRKFRKPMKNITGSTANGGEVNQLYLAYISNTATTVMDFDYQIRVRYTVEND